MNIACNWLDIWAVMAVLFGLMAAWGARKCTQSKDMMASGGEPKPSHFPYRSERAVVELDVCIRPLMSKAFEKH